MYIMTRGSKYTNQVRENEKKIWMNIGLIGYVLYKSEVRLCLSYTF